MDVDALQSDRRPNSEAIAWYLQAPQQPEPVQPAPPPPDTPLDETVAPIHYEGDTKSV
ncbi:MAG TPA: hypothetical protein VFT19_10170 [Solirubrobacterales bacterium]|nr:hypothetical protein [Solirubrobacterales bacterium]